MTQYRKVRVGARYVYRPVLFDKLNPPVDLQPGEECTVVNLPGCPRANTMGMCHVNNSRGTFGGMVVTNSLIPIREGRSV